MGNSIVDVQMDLTEKYCSNAGAVCAYRENKKLQIFEARSQLGHVFTSSESTIKQQQQEQQH